MFNLPIIPEYIIVHLGSPDSNARNIRVNFVEYIKNVASGELYPNWPLEALRANILAIVSFALNRIYNEWYRSRGYSFDITSSSQYDQSFEEGRQFFERIYILVDELFNDYIVRSGQVQPLFSSYCDGKVSTCQGMSQWGSVSFANQGLDALSILKKYYGNDIQIISDNKVSPIMDSYPGRELALGDAGDEVYFLKVQLNRISQNYPAIPTILNDSIYFDIELENAIKVFQRSFSLSETGKVNSSTWYKIKYYYNAVKKISNLYSEGIKKDEVVLQIPSVLKQGDTGDFITELHYYLNVIACYDNNLIYNYLVGKVYNQSTKENVFSFQRRYRLKETGEVDRTTWNMIISVYKSYIKTIPVRCRYSLNDFFPGRYLTLGISGEDVLNLQRILYVICEATHEIPGVIVSGEYDSLTEKSIRFLQDKLGLDSNGVVTAETWSKIVDYQKNLF